MRITNKQLKQIIKEELDHVLNESELQNLLGLGHTFSTRQLHLKAAEYIATNPNMPQHEKSVIANAISNRLVKDQLSIKNDELGKDLNGLLIWLDPDKARRQGYRGSVEAEMRALSDKYDKMGIGPYDQERPFKIRKQYKE